MHSSFMRTAALCALLLAFGAPARVHAAASAAPPGDSLVGDWGSPDQGRGVIHVQPTGDSTVVISGPGQFVAQCFLEGTSLIGLARFRDPGTLAPGDLARFAMLRATWSNPTTLKVSWISPANGKPFASETWSFKTHVAPADRKVVVAVGSGPDSLPRFGDYVYVEELPEAITRVNPIYPAEARAKGIDGVVMVQALVGTDGHVKDTRVVKSIPMLDEAATACVRLWEFKPALSHGAPVAVWVGVPVKFSLH